MTPHLWPLRSYLELGALPTAVPCARLHARQLVWEWGLNGLAANTELLVSELVTNAVKATAGNNDQAAICLQLSGDNTRVLIEVWDADPQPPVPKDLDEDGTPDPQEEGGRGLFLVAALSTRWAWYLTEKPTGKVVWCELSAEPPESSEGAQSAPQALLPRRMPHEQQTADRGDARSGRPTPTPGSSPRSEPCPESAETPERLGSLRAFSSCSLALAKANTSMAAGGACCQPGHWAARASAWPAPWPAAIGEAGRAGGDVSQSRWAGCSALPVAGTR